MQNSRHLASLFPSLIVLDHGSRLCDPVRTWDMSARHSAPSWQPFRPLANCGCGDGDDGPIWRFSHLCLPLIGHVKQGVHMYLPTTPPPPPSDRCFPEGCPDVCFLLCACSAHSSASAFVLALASGLRTRSDWEHIGRTGDSTGPGYRRCYHDTSLLPG